MKVLFLAPANSVHTIRWVNALTERGYQIFLVSLKNHRNTTNVINDKVTIIYLSYEGEKGYYLNAISLHRICMRIKPDVINVHYASGYGTLARIAHLPHIILSVWGSDVYVFPYKNKITHWIIKKNLLYADHLASTSCIMAKQVRTLVGDKNISVTPFGVDLAVFSANHKLPKHMFTIGVIKSLSEIYGIDIVIRAFAYFCKMNLSIFPKRLEIYGDGEQREELEKLCHELEVSDSVFFKGFIPHDQIPDVLSTIDVVCFGSRSESFGVAALEAMACEIPVIATEVDGFKEVIDDKVTGFLVPVNDYISMAQYMQCLFENQNLRKIMGKNGRMRVESLYDWDKNVEIMMNLYKENSRNDRS